MSKRISPSVVIAVVALFAAIAGGTAVAVRTGSAAKPTLKVVDDNPEGASDPCAADEKGVFCGVISPPYTGWSHYDNGFAKVGYLKDDDGIVHLGGVAIAEGSPSDTIFILPGKYRPADGRDFAVACGEGGASNICRLRVRPNGEVYQRSGVQTDGISLDGATYPAG